MIITTRKVTEYDMHVSRSEIELIKYALGMVVYSNTPEKNKIMEGVESLRNVIENLLMIPEK